MDERNRPPHLKREAEEDIPEETKEVETMTGSMAAAGVDPTLLSERTLSAIRENRFWVLPPKEDSWRVAARIRNQGIEEATNPALGGPVAEGEL